MGNYCTCASRGAPPIDIQREIDKPSKPKLGKSMLRSRYLPYRSTVYRAIIESEGAFEGPIFFVDVVKHL